MASMKRMKDNSFERSPHLTFATAIPLSLTIGAYELSFTLFTSLTFWQVAFVRFIFARRSTDHVAVRILITLINYQSITVVGLIVLNRKCRKRNTNKFSAQPKFSINRMIVERTKLNSALFFGKYLLISRWCRCNCCCNNELVCCSCCCCCCWNARICVMGKHEISGLFVSCCDRALFDLLKLMPDDWLVKKLLLLLLLLLMLLLLLLLLLLLWTLFVDKAGNWKFRSGAVNKRANVGEYALKPAAALFVVDPRPDVIVDDPFCLVLCEGEWYFQSFQVDDYLKFESEPSTTVTFVRIPCSKELLWASDKLSLVCFWLLFIDECPDWIGCNVTSGYPMPVAWFLNNGVLVRACRLLFFIFILAAKLFSLNACLKLPAMFNNYKIVMSVRRTTA